MIGGGEGRGGGCSKDTGTCMYMYDQVPKLLELYVSLNPFSADNGQQSGELQEWPRD